MTANQIRSPRAGKAGHCPESGKKLVKAQKLHMIRSLDYEEGEPLDWTRLFRAFKESFDWALDVARQLARDYPEEVDAVERVRQFMHRRIDGRLSHVKIDDVLFTFGLLIGAIERDLGPVKNLGPWFAAGPTARFPGADELGDHVVPQHVSRPTVRIRPAHRATA